MNKFIEIALAANKELCQVLEIDQSIESDAEFDAQPNVDLLVMGNREIGRKLGL